MTDEYVYRGSPSYWRSMRDVVGNVRDWPAEEKDSYLASFVVHYARSTGRDAKEILEDIAQVSSEFELRELEAA